jgi:hypothetical protein
MRTTTVLLGAVALTVAAGAQSPKSPQKPGKWQVTMEMDMPGMPMKMKPMTHEMCVTEEDLKDPQKNVPADPKSDCKVTDYKVKDNTLTWAMDCPSQQAKGTGEMTYTASGESYTGAMTMAVAGREMTTKYTGKWLGAACTK